MPPLPRDDGSHHQRHLVDVTCHLMGCDETGTSSLCFPSPNPRPRSDREKKKKNQKKIRPRLGDVLQDRGLFSSTLTVMKNKDRETIRDPLGQRRHNNQKRCVPGLDSGTGRTLAKKAGEIQTRPGFLNLVKNGFTSRKLCFCY